jgi:hypothetical protein
MVPGKVEFSFELTNEKFKQELAEIYPRLKNACFVFMIAGKDNALKELNPGRCCYRCYTPEKVHNSERGQGRLYIRIISENEVLSTVFRNFNMLLVQAADNNINQQQKFRSPL